MLLLRLFIFFFVCFCFSNFHYYVISFSVDPFFAAAWDFLGWKSCFFVPIWQDIIYLRPKQKSQIGNQHKLSKQPVDHYPGATYFVTTPSSKHPISPAFPWNNFQENSDGTNLRYILNTYFTIQYSSLSMFPPASSIISVDLRILQRSASRIAPPKSGRASVAGWLLLAEEDARVFEWMVLMAAFMGCLRKIQQMV